MRFYLGLFFCVSVFFISCGDERNKIPDGILPLHAMAALLTDIHIVDGSTYNVPQQPDSLAKHSLGLYLAVFKAHNTDSTTFKKSLKFYSTRPDMLDVIYGGINSRLTKKLDSLQKIKPKIDPDSLKRVAMHRKIDSLKVIKADSLKVAKAKAKIDSLQKASKLKKPAHLKLHRHKQLHALSK